MTRQEAVANITWLYATYVSRYAGNLRDAVDLFEVYVEQGGWSVQEAYDQVTSAVLHDAAFYDEAFPGHMPAIGQVFDDNAIPHDLVLDYFYPSASAEDRSALLVQLESGAVSNRDFVKAWPFVAREQARPGVVEVLQAVVDKTSGMPVLPHADLGISGLSDADLDFLISLYMASFGRAPEHAGLLWWAGETLEMREAGPGDAEVTREIAMRMYDGGAAQGESGTDKADEEYVAQAYLNVLGRQAEAAGRKFWVDQLEQGLARGEFVAAFLAATRNEDREYLDARIQVGRHVAQEHVSGPDMPALDLGLVLEGVGNVVQAYAAIRDIQDKYGEALSGAPEKAQAPFFPAMARAGTVETGRHIMSAGDHDGKADAEVLIIGLATDSEQGLMLV